MEASDSRDSLQRLKRALLALEKMQSRIAELESVTLEPIAVVGLGTRMPGGGDSPDSFWNLLRDGIDATSEVPPDRWDVGAYYDPDPGAPGKMYTRRGAFVDRSSLAPPPESPSPRPRRSGCSGRTLPAWKSR